MFIPILIPIVRRRREVSISTWKAIKCSFCDCEFVYSMYRTTRGPASGARFGSQEVVACPQCGFYQDEMVEAIRRRCWGWLTIVSVLCCVLALLLACFGEAQPTFWSRLFERPALYAWGACLGLMGIRFLVRYFHNPNARASARIGSVQAHVDGPYLRIEFDRAMHEVLHPKDGIGI
jgi:hypothetical protein